MTIPLVEPSFFDLIAAIEQEFDLTEQLRRHWTCSLRQIATWLDRPAALIPARWNAVQIAIGHLHHARIGVTAKTLANHKSNVRAALRWFGRDHDVPQRGMVLSAAWARLCNRIDVRMRDRLYSLIRYCSARGIAPAAVNDTVLDGAIAPRPRHGPQTIRPDALWSERGIAARQQSINGRSSAWRNRLSESSSPLGPISPSACAGILTAISPLSLGRIESWRQPYSTMQSSNDPDSSS